LLQSEYPSWTATQANVLYCGPQESSVQWTSLTPPTQIAQMNWPHDPQGGFGPELTVGKTISDALGGQVVAEVKYAVDGTNLHTDWNPDIKGSRYYQMLSRVNDALTKLPQQTSGAYVGKVAGFFWMQGESDAWDGRLTSQYQADLTNLIARVRTDFGDRNLPFVFGRITTMWGDGYSVRQAQSNVDATVPYTFMVDTDNFPRDAGDSGMHYSTLGEIQLGIGLANGYLSTVPEPSTFALLGIGVVGLLVAAWRPRPPTGDSPAT